MTFYRYDPDTDSLVECDPKTVVCTTTGCENEGIPIQVADDPNATVVCGPCGNQIEEG